jgi:hypothetical protein
LLALHGQFNILERGPRAVPVAADNAADVWRIMCKHVYHYKKHDRRCTPALHVLMDFIELLSRSLQSLFRRRVANVLPVKSMGLPLAHMALRDIDPMEPIDLATAKALFKDIDEEEDPLADCEVVDADVEVVSITCTCSGCMKVPAASRGGQRRESLAAKDAKKPTKEKRTKSPKAVKAVNKTMDLSRPWQVAIVQRKASGKKRAEAYITVNKRY